MPYSLSNDHPDCSGWAVVKDEDGSMVAGGCHATQAEAQSHLTALNIAEYGDRQAEPGGGVLPDGYRPAVSDDVPEGRACGNCRFYSEDRVKDGVEVWCDLWAAWVRGDHYCDRWEERETADVDSGVANVGYDGAQDVDSRGLQMKRDQLRGVRETRQWGLSGVELREQADGTVTFSGYASVYNRGYSVFDQFGEYEETIAPGAFDRTLTEAPDVVLVVNHEGLPLARTKSGTLQLSADSVGLRVEAQLDRSDPDVQALLPKFRRGDVDEMSFAFRVNGQEWSDDYSKRTITEISLSRGDVSIVTFGANPHTLAMVRAALQNDQVREQLLAEDAEAARVLTKGNAAPLVADESDNQDAPAEKPAVVEPASEPEPVVEEPAEEKPAAKKSPAKKRSVVDVAPIDMEALSADVAVDNIEGDSAQWFAENYRRLVALKSR